MFRLLCIAAAALVGTVSSTVEMPRRRGEAPPAVCSNYTIANSTTGLVDRKTMLKAVPCSNSTHCCSLCSAEPKCVAFTYTHKSCRMTSFPSPHHDHGPVFSGQSSRPVPPGPPPGPSPSPPTPVNPPNHPNYCKGKPGKCKNVLYFISDDMRADWG